MTEKMKKIYSIAIIASALLLSSCNDFLDKLPDDRATVDSEEKVNNLIATAYPTHSPIMMLEMSSDNMMDNGKQYTAQPNQEAMYRWEEVTTTGNDDPRSLWNSCYTAVATANEALQGINSIGADQLKPQRAEALLCRAYGMFVMANTFCMAYNPDKAGEYLGLPYPTEPEQSVETKYERGTLEELYAKINADIEEALPMVDDNHLAGKAVKYHFNRKAAYAFAARFNLYYQKWDKAIQYATEVLGNNPSGVLRDYWQFKALAGPEDINNAYISSGENANLMLLTAYSTAARVFNGSSSYLRYNHSRVLSRNETYWARMPWGSGSDATTSKATTHLLVSNYQYGNAQVVFFPNIREKFEYTDKVNGTGYAHIVDPVFTGEETLLVRAEAYALTKQYDKALADMNAWQASHCTAGYTPFTEAVINDFMDKLAYQPTVPTSDLQRSVKKTLSPQGFTVEAGTQENIIQTILHMRRIETMRQGLRFQDLKRYGIKFSHNLDGEEALVFEPGDLRGAIQLPADVVKAGLEANPRK